MTRLLRRLSPLLLCLLLQAVTVYDSLCSQSLALAWQLAGTWHTSAEVENLTSASLPLFAQSQIFVHLVKIKNWAGGPDTCQLCDFVKVT